jgi:hypothetical protein
VAVPLAVVLPCLAGLSVLLARWTAPAASISFVLGVVLLLWLPGHLVLDLLGLRPPPLEALTLALLLGVAASSLVFWAGSVVGVPDLIWAWAALAVVAVLVRRRREPARLVGRFRREHAALLAVVATALLPFVLLDFAWPNLASREQDSLSFLPLQDAVFHLAIVHELEHSVPPEVPWLAGADLSYHYEFDLLAALVSRLPGVDAVDATLRFLPALFVVTTVLATYALARRWLRSSVGAVLVAALVAFAEDFAYVPGLLLGSSAPWSVAFFQVPTVFSLYVLNSMLAAVGVLMAALLCLFAYVERPRIGWAIAFGGLTALLAELKVFTAVQLLGALALVAVFGLWKRRSTALAAPLAVATVLTALPLLVTFALTGPNPNTIGVGITPFLSETLRGLSLDTLAAHGGRAALVLVGLPLFVVGSLGLRLLAAPALLRPRLVPHVPPEQRGVVAVFTVGGLALTLATTITPEGTVGAADNAVWFYVGAKHTAWLFVAASLVAWWRDRPLSRQILVAAAVVALSVPATVQFFAAVTDNPSNYLLHETPAVIDRDEDALLDALDARCTDGDVALAPVRVLVPMLALTGCRTPYFDLFSRHLVDAGEAERRAGDVASFWQAWNEGRCRSDVVGAYSVRLVVSATGRASPRRCGSRMLRRAFARAGLEVLELGAPASRQ